MLAPLWYGCGLLLLALVTVQFLQPLSGNEPEINDKLGHFVIYTMLSGWFGLLVTGRRWLLAVWFGLVVYGIAIEGLQGLTEYRSAEWGDVIANSLGAAAGLLVFFTGLPRVLRLLDARLAALLGR